MASVFRNLFLATLSVSALAVTACSTTVDSNMSNPKGASRVDAILERAAKEARASGNMAETISLLDQVYQRNQDDPAIATGYAQALREDDQFTRARQVVAPFTTGKNAYPDAVIELAMVQLSLGQYKDAELTAKKATNLDPESGRAYLALGTALDAQNNHDDAEAAFRKGIDKWKGDPAPIMNNLALNLASQDKLDQAIDMLEKAQEISPNRTEIERNLRIIRTLKEGADDFTQKPPVEKKAAPAPVKKETVKEEPKKAEPKAEPKKAEEKPVEAKPKAKAKPDAEKEKATNTNRRGSTQSFNND